MEDTKQSNDATTIKITVEVDSSEIDVAIEKANQLKTLLGDAPSSLDEYRTVSCICGKTEHVLYAKYCTNCGRKLEINMESK